MNFNYLMVNTRNGRVEHGWTEFEGGYVGAIIAEAKRSAKINHSVVVGKIWNGETSGATVVCGSDYRTFESLSVAEDFVSDKLRHEFRKIVHRLKVVSSQIQVIRKANKEIEFTISIEPRSART